MQISNQRGCLVLQLSGAVILGTERQLKEHHFQSIWQSVACSYCDAFPQHLLEKDFQIVYLDLVLIVSVNSKQNVVRSVL